MALKIKGITTSVFNLFGESLFLSQGVAEERPRAESETLVVSKDGTGDFGTIQEAINQVEQNGKGGTIFIKEGTYEQSITKFPVISQSNITIKGTGKSTIIKQLGDTRALAIVASGAPIYNIKVKDIQFLGNGAGGASSNHGVELDGAQIVEVSSCVFTNIGGRGIAVAGTINLNIFNCEFITTNNIAIHANNASQSKITNNDIQSGSGDGIFIRGTTASADIKIEGNTVNDNGGFGINLDDAGVSNCIINGNTIRGNTSGAIDNNGIATQIGHNTTA